MSYGKKSSIGSAEELETYGVWIKSEPQDITAEMADMGGFGGGGFPLGPGDYESPQIDLDSGYNYTASDNGADDFFGGFDDGLNAGFSAGPDLGEDQNFQGEMSNKLLVKIADELSSIRTDLSTLKREFEDIRGEGGETTGRNEERIGGFFSDDDEKITLSDDEMTDIFNSTDFSGINISSYDPLREEDEEALRKLSEQNEASGIPEEDENNIIEIDFNNLGIVFDDQEEKPESVVEAWQDTGVSSFPDDSFGDLPPLEDFTSMSDEDAISELADLEKISLSEENPFASLDVFDEISLGENSLDITFDDAFELNDDPFAAPAGGITGELSAEESFDPISLDLSDVVIDEPDISGLTASPHEGLILDDFSLDDFSIEDEPVAAKSDFDELGIAKVIPEAFENDAVESAIPFDDDLDGFVEEELSAEIEEPLTEQLAKEPEILAVPESSKSAETVFSEPISPVMEGEMNKELKDVLSYMDHLLESLPEEKIEEFARSDYFDAYKKLFKDLGLTQDS